MQPPVFVMNPYYSGLGIARSLHGMGVRVYALTSQDDAPGAGSRYFYRVHKVPNVRDDPERLRDRLIELAGNYQQRPVLFPTRDFDVLFLQQYRDALAPAYVLPQPGDSSILRILDKLELARVAKEQGIATPATSVCRSVAELERELATLRFPVVLKPRFAHEWHRKGVWEKVGAAKAMIVNSPEQLRYRYRQLSEASPEVLLQQYVAGNDTDIVVCGCYISRNGEMLGHFTARKLKQNPPLIGTGSVVEATEVPAVVGLSLRLLKAFGYSGLAEVEFKYDCVAQEFFLIEVNPRHWDQHELGSLVGVNLTDIAYREMIGAPALPTSPVYLVGRRYKWIAERELIYAAAQDFRSRVKAARAPNGLLRAILQVAGNMLGELREVFRGRKTFAIVRLRDPQPGIAMFVSLFAEVLQFLRRVSRPAWHGRARERKIG